MTSKNVTRSIPLECEGMLQFQQLFHHQRRQAKNKKENPTLQPRVLTRRQDIHFHIAEYQRLGLFDRRLGSCR